MGRPYFIVSTLLQVKSPRAPYPRDDRLPQLVGDIMALHALDVEAFSPCLKYTMINVLLSGRI